MPITTRSRPGRSHRASGQPSAMLATTRASTLLRASCVASALLLPCQTFAADVDGKYVLRNDHRLHELLIFNRSDEGFDFELTTSWYPAKNSTPTSGYFSGKAVIKRGIGLAKDASNAGCDLVFNIQRKPSIEVISFGECFHGHNAYPDEVYQLERSEPR
ncbi:hypothetical protein ACWA7J_08115 [Leptothrix sp. BB-4]